MSTFAKITIGLAHTVDHWLSNIQGSQEKDQEVRKILSKYAPCPVLGASWSIVNAIDYNFEGFSSARLTTYTTTRALKKLVHMSPTPDLHVVRDLCLAAKLAYEDPKVIRYFCDKWNMKTEPLNFSSTDTQAFIMHDDNNVVLSFRGTEFVDAQDWATDFKIDLVPLHSTAFIDGADSANEMKHPSVLVHKGFYDALGLGGDGADISAFSKIYDLLYTLTDNTSKKIWITGHSLGAALASVFVANLIINAGDELLDKIGGLYTYGQPRCGNQDYANLFEKLNNEGLIFRVVNKSDIVPKLPYKVIGYAHHGCEFVIEKKGIHVGGSAELTIQSPKQGKLKLSDDSTTLKKVIFAVLPKFIEDHYPSEYIRNLEAVFGALNG